MSAQWGGARTRCASLITALVLSLVRPSIAEAQRHPVDGVVAIVGGHTPGPSTDVVLRSDVELRAWLALASRGAPTRDVPEALLAATFEELLGELLIEREAERLHAPEPSSVQVARHRDDLARSIGGEDALVRFLAEHHVGEDEILAVARRRAFVDAFLRANLEGSTLVSDAQIDEAYELGEHPFVGRPLREVRELLRAWLGAAALARDVRRWVEVLRSRTPVRIVVPFAPGEPESA